MGQGLELTVDDLLIYSQCPMKAFFKVRLGMDERVATTTGHLGVSLRAACQSFLSSYDPQDKNKSMRIGMAAIARKLADVPRPSDARAGTKKAKYDARLDYYLSAMEHFIDQILSMDCQVLGSPLAHHVTFNNQPYLTTIDAALLHNGVVDVVTFDTSSSAPSEEYLDDGIRATIAGFLFREMSPTSRFRLIHYWILGTGYIEVHRSDSQYMGALRELNNLAAICKDATDNNLWYRSRGFWCKGCGLSEPCKESGKVMGVGIV